MTGGSGYEHLMYPAVRCSAEAGDPGPLHRLLARKNLSEHNIYPAEPHSV